MTGQREVMMPVLVTGFAAAAGLAAVVVWLRRHLAVIEVYGPSMEPSLHAGDRVLVRRTPLPRVRAGDIIVYHDPDHDGDWAPGSAARKAIAASRRGVTSGLWMVKRAVAVPGDPVPAAVAPVVAAAPGARVPNGCLVVLGDNAERSYDSRDCGYIAADHLLGVVRRHV